MKAMKKNLFQRVFTLALMLTLVFSMGATPVFAADGDMRYYIVSGPEAVGSEVSTAWMPNLGVDGEYTVTLYSEAGGDPKASAISSFALTVKGGKVVASTLPAAFSNIVVEKGGTQQAVDAIQDIKDLTHVKADLSDAAGTLAPIIEIVNTVIGVLATAILILVGLFTAIDILYLEVPAFHNSMDQKGMEKGQTNKSGGVKHKLISEDASQAFQEASESGKNPMIVYLKKRIVAYVAVAIVLYMLLSGNLSLIVEVVLKMLNGVFGWVEDYSATM